MIVRVLTGGIITMCTFLFVGMVSAHSTVSPSQVGTSKYENFSLSVPTEKEIPTVGIRVLIPESISKVTPFVKFGWRITVKKDTSDKATEIEWVGGTVPAGQKDIFQFTAVTPKEKTTLVWKVYQTYQDRTIVAWDQDPKRGYEHEENEKVTNPYSVTEVLDDTTLLSGKTGRDMNHTKRVNLTFIFSLGALLISAGALFLTLRRRDSNISVK